MKGFLLDENIPYRLQFEPSLPVLHSSDLGPSPADGKLWEYAQTNQLVVVTKDSDFSDRILVSSPPPWVIHLCFGNLRRAAFHSFLKRVWPRVEILLPDHKLINIYLDRIETVS